jgi:hypothetical protein
MPRRRDGLRERGTGCGGGLSSQFSAGSRTVSRAAGGCRPRNQAIGGERPTAPRAVPAHRPPHPSTPGPLPRAPPFPPRCTRAARPDRGRSCARGRCPRRWPHAVRRPESDPIRSAPSRQHSGPRPTVPAPHRCRGTPPRGPPVHQPVRPLQHLIRRLSSVPAATPPQQPPAVLRSSSALSNPCHLRIAPPREGQRGYGEVSKTAPSTP